MNRLNTKSQPIMTQEMLITVIIILNVPKHISDHAVSQQSTA